VLGLAARINHLPRSGNRLTDGSTRRDHAISVHAGPVAVDRFHAILMKEITRCAGANNWVCAFPFASNLLD
jgi:hypothetical protein